MVRKKMFSTALATVMVLSIVLSLSTGSTVQAAETTEIPVIAGEIMGIDSEAVELIYPEQVQITEFDETVDNYVSNKINGKIEIDETKVQTVDAPMAVDDSTVLLAGSVSDYLTATNDGLLYSLVLPAGVYLQVQLTTPANADLDYDLYLLDADGQVLTGCDYYTYLNGSLGTLPEAFGYFTLGDTATYYIYVLSSQGGSINQAFTLDYSISVACDRWESDENAREALPFTFGVGGAYIDSRNLSSPVDNEFYEITIPSDRIYDKLKITATTSSANTCSVEVYQNISSSGYQMKRVGSGSTIPVSTGTYYIRVSNAKTMEQYDDLDIQNYTLSITPILTANTIVITDLSGTEGKNKVVNYPGYGTYFRTETGNLTIYGVAAAADSTTGSLYAVEGQEITGTYYSPAWDANNTPSNAYRTATGYTDSQGNFTITIPLPNAIGKYTYDSGVSYHYFDICAVQALVADNPSVSDEQPIFHLAYTSYHPF